MITLIIGFGEVGMALNNILSDHYETLVLDKEDMGDLEDIEIMHICFPYSKDFVKEVKKYQKLHTPKYTVIHSTVPIGTSRQCNAIHSPVVGLHPFLEESLKTFTKFLGGSDSSKVADYFRRANIKVYLTDKQETTEMMKIMSTTYHGLCIEFTKEVKRLCDKNNVPFELWTLWNENYNEGYKTLGHPEYKRPNLLPIMKPIGGHCIMTNLNFISTDFTKLIKKRNEK